MANFNWSKLALVAVTLLLCALYNNSAQAMPSKRQAKLCGSKLPETMLLVCPNGFRSHIAQKRSFLNIFDYVELQNDAGDDEQLTKGDSKFNWQDEPKNYNSMVATRRHMRRIVDECCYKPCTYNEMAAYCQQ